MVNDHDVIVVQAYLDATKKESVLGYEDAFSVLPYVNLSSSVFAIKDGFTKGLPTQKMVGSAIMDLCESPIADDGHYSKSRRNGERTSPATQREYYDLATDSFHYVTLSLARRRTSRGGLTSSNQEASPRNVECYKTESGRRSSYGKNEGNQRRVLIGEKEPQTTTADGTIAPNRNSTVITNIVTRK